MTDKIPVGYRKVFQAELSLLSAAPQSVFSLAETFTCFGGMYEFKYNGLWSELTLTT